VQTPECPDRAKSFLNTNARRLVLRAALVASMAMAAHAVTSNALVFNAPGSTSVSDNCSGSDTINTPLTGATANGGPGLTLSGDATLSVFPSAGTQCTLTMTWSGTGSGTFGGTTGTIFSKTSPGFTIVPGTEVFVTGWNLTVFINGNSAGQVNCATTIPNPYLLDVRAPKPRNQALGGVDCSQAASPAGTFAVPSTLSTWRVVLAVTAAWYFTDFAQPLEVTVPPGGSIDLSATPGASIVPALTPLAFGMTAILLLSLAGLGILRRESRGSGFPGRPS